MAVIQDFEFNIFDRNLKWKRPLTSLLDMDAKVVHNDAGTTSFTVRNNNPSMDELMQPGCRVGVHFRGLPLTSGLILERVGTTRKGRGPLVAGAHKFRFVDDFQVFKNIQAWPAPGRPISQQGDDEAYYSLGSVPAETALKDVFTRNAVQRLGMKIQVEPDQRRGGPVNIQFRMNYLFDKLFPAVDLAGIGARIRLDPSGGRRLLEVYTPRIFPYSLDEENRVVQEGDWNLQAPTVTRGTVGGQGQGTERHFEAFQDLTREQLWGEVMETSVDARDTASADAYTKRAAEALMEGSAADSLTVKLIETGHFSYGGEKGIHVGDGVTARMAGGLISITEVLRDATLSWTPESGVKINSTVGVTDDPTAPVQKAIVSLDSRVRELKAG